MNRGVIFILISMSSIGLSIPIGGVMMETFPVFLFSFITIVIAGIILVPFASIYDKTKWLSLGWKNHLALFLQAMLTVTLYTVFQLYGLTHASAISVGIITSITPAVVMILAFFLLRERLNLKKLSAIALAVSAVLIMELAGVQVAGGSSSLGIVYMLLAVVSMSLFFIYAKHMSVNLPALTLAAGMCLYGTIQLLPMAIVEFIAFDKTVFSLGSTWFGIIYFAFTAWVFAYSFTFLGLPRINASTAGMATAAIPIIATVVAIVFYGAPIRMVDLIALVLVVGCIMIAGYEERITEIPIDKTSEQIV